MRKTEENFVFNINISYYNGKGIKLLQNIPLSKLKLLFTLLKNQSVSFQYECYFCITMWIDLMVSLYTAWKVSTFGVFMVHIFSHFEPIQRYSMSLRIQSECGKILTIKTRIIFKTTDTFHALIMSKYNWVININPLTLSWRGPLSYINQSIDLQSKSMDWFLCNNGLGHERVKCIFILLNKQCSYHFAHLYLSCSQHDFFKF